MLIALTHAPSPLIAQCELTFLERKPIDYRLAARQHAAYGNALRECGADVRTLNVNSGDADGVFIEDTAIVLDELAILASMGARSRRGEIDNIEPELARYRETKRIAPPATIEGGDVLRVAQTLYVGISSRTNRAGVEALRNLVRPRGYRVIAVEVRGCLHLKSACTALDDSTLLLNPAWVDPSSFEAMKIVAVPDGEPGAANTLRVHDTICIPDVFPQTAQLIARLGFDLKTIEISEFLKAEAGVTCMSIVFADGA